MDMKSLVHRKAAINVVCMATSYGNLQNTFPFHRSHQFPIEYHVNHFIKFNLLFAAQHSTFESVSLRSMSLNPLIPQKTSIFFNACTVILVKEVS